MKWMLLILLALCLCGCPGHINVHQSEFDNATEVSMVPAVLERGGIKLGLLWTTRMAPEDLILSAYVGNAHHFADGASLKFNIDGKVVGLESMDQITDLDLSTGNTWSYKRYAVKRELVQQLIDAKKVIVKIELPKTYLEGFFSSDLPMTARPAFVEFLKTLDEEQKRLGAKSPANSSPS